MALNDAKFKTDVIELLDEMIQKEDYETAKIEYADKLCKAIKEYLKSGTITGTSNQGAFTGTIE